MAKGKKKPATKGKGKYDITVKIDATFDELLKAGMGIKSQAGNNQ